MQQFGLCPLKTSHWRYGGAGLLCGGHYVEASTRHGLTAVLGWYVGNSNNRPNAVLESGAAKVSNAGITQNHLGTEP